MAVHLNGIIHAVSWHVAFLAVDVLVQSCLLITNICNSQVSSVLLLERSVIVVTAGVWLLAWDLLK